MAGRSRTAPGLKKYASWCTRASRLRMRESLSSYIDSFLAMISVEKGLAKNTIEAYSRDLSGLSGFLISQGVNSWTDVQSFHLRAYLSWLRKRGLSASSITRHIVTLRRLCRFLQTEGV